MDEIVTSSESETPGPASRLATVVSLIAELVLVTVTIGIIAAMWLPAYLTGRPADRELPEPGHEGPSPAHTR